MDADAFQSQVDAIGGEVGQISDALRGYLDHGFAYGRKVQPPKTKAGRDLLLHVLGRLNQVSAGLLRVQHSSAPATPHIEPLTGPHIEPLNGPQPRITSHVSPSPPAIRGLETPLSSSDPPTVSHHTQTQTPPRLEQADRHLENSQPQIHHLVAPLPVPPVEEPTLAPATLITAPLPTPLPAPISTPILTAPPNAIPAAIPAAIQHHSLPHQAFGDIRLKDGSVYRSPLPSAHASPVFDCTYQDIHILNEELFELYSSHSTVRDLGYFKIQVRNLPPLNVQKMARPTKDHATSFGYKADHLGLIKVDTGKRFKFSSPRLPLPTSAKTDWSLAEQRDLWNSSAADPPKGTSPYIIGNPLFHDVVLSPGEKLRRRGRATLEGINTQYVYFNLTGKTITTMHREDAHVRSENLLRSGQHKFWCFVKPAFGKKLEERMALEYPEMRRCSQAVRHLSRHIPPAKLDEWGIEYTLDYCVPGQAVVTEPGTYHQVLNLGPNYAIAINMEYNSSPDMPIDYYFCDRLCPDKFAMTAEDFRIYDKPPQPAEEQLPRTPDTTGSQERLATALALEDLAKPRPENTVSPPVQSATPPPEQAVSQKHELAGPQLAQVGVRSLPEQEFPETDNRNTPTNASKGVVVEDIPQSQGHMVQPQSLDHPGPVSSIPIPTQSAPSPFVPPERSFQLPHEVNGPGAFAPGSEHQLTQLRPPTLEYVSDRFEPSVTAPVPQPSLPIQQAPAAVPGAVAYSSQMVWQAPSPIRQDMNHCGYHGSSMGKLPPLRKTARMINPDREYDEPTPRPLKKQKVESPPAPVAQDWPVRGAFEHLSTLVRGQDTARKGSVVAEKLCGKPAFERLAHLVREWRRYSKSTPMVLGGFRLLKSIEETLRGYPELHTFLSRLFKMKLAANVGTTMAQPAGESPHNFTNAMLQKLGWDETKRPTLHDYLREGKCWNTICGDYDGLLCFVPSDSQCLDLALYKDEVARLHAELDTDFVRRLCAAGSILQRSIWDCLELPEFIWESAVTTWLPVERISPLVAPFRLLKANHYDEKSGFYWPRPAGWDWHWPANPGAVKPGDKQCSLCPRKSCRCAEMKIPQIPRVSDDRSKGPGVRSVGPHRANDILGELVGELVPPGACAGDWTMALRRPDLDDEPVADIYPRQMGNWVRKVSHSSDPSAVFRMLKISGRWCQMLVALRNIGDGEEITAKYGKGFQKEQPYSLVEGLR